MAGVATGQTQLPNVKLPKTRPEKIVGLVSDTHVPARASRIPEGVFKVFENADFIVHAGDLVELNVLDELEQVAPVLAVRGNMDGPAVSGVLPTLNSFKLMDRKIGVVHDAGGLYVREKMAEIAMQNQFDVLVFGHTHTSQISWEGKRLFINPGSPTSPEPPFLCKPSVALLRITKQAIIPEIVEI